MTIHELGTSPEPVQIVGKSELGMLHAVRKVLAGMSTMMGGLEHCDATLVPQVLDKGTQREFRITASVIKR